MKTKRTNWKVLTKLLDTVPEIGAGSPITRTAKIASASAAAFDQVEHVRVLVKARAWNELIHIRDGNWCADWIVWKLVDRPQAPIIVEIYYAYELWTDDSAHVLLELSQNDYEAACPYLHSWESPA